MTVSRSERVSLRFRPHELESIDAAAAAARCTRSEIVRQAALGFSYQILSSTPLGRVGLSSQPVLLPQTGPSNSELVGPESRTATRADE